MSKDSATPRPPGELKLYIGGEYVAARSGETFANVNPATGEEIGAVHVAGQEDVDAAVEAAKEGFAEWSARSGTERGRVLRRVNEILRARNDELARLETLDSGKPLQESLSVDVELAADCFEYYAGVAPTISGEYMHSPTSFCYTRREPLGVCAGIGAWNYPLQVTSWKVAPALACGNAMVYKPAELTPLTSTLLADILAEAGAPAGAYNVVNGFGSTGAMLSRHKGIEKVSLTGEVSTGKLVMGDAASTLKHVTLELGGKSPLIVFPDADLDEAASAALLGNFYTQGEVCTNCTRVFVHGSVMEPFLERVVGRTRKLKVGDPTDPETQVGSLISKEHQEKVLGYIRMAQEAGAKLLCGGGIPADPALANGAFVEPTVFAECDDGMPNVRDEIFGPVMSILRFEDEEEVIARANDTDFGLAAGVFTSDLARGQRVVARLQAGICWINNYNIYPMQLPAGGFKQSGLGTENGMETVRQYTQLKTVYVEMGKIDSPYE